jgi:hypothetical protein
MSLGRRRFSRQLGRNARAEISARERGCAMQIVQDTILRHLGKVLHDYVDDVTHEPVPRRWLYLIRHLDEQERRGEVRNWRNQRLAERPH